MRHEAVGILKARVSPKQVTWDQEYGNEPAMQPDRSRLAELGARASAIGHELRQPLFTISMASENLRAMLDRPEIPRQKFEQAIDRIAEQVERAQTIIARTLELATGAPARHALADPAKAMGNAIRFLDSLLGGIEVTARSAQGSPAFLVAIDQVEMEQIFVNILRNAVDSIRTRLHASGGGVGRIDATFATDEDGRLRCTVRDNGAGLSQGVPQTGFRPFFTTKSSEGTGLGLYISESIVAAAGGEIHLRAGEKEGAVVEIVLPLISGRRASDRIESQA